MAQIQPRGAIPMFTRIKAAFGILFGPNPPFVEGPSAMAGGLPTVSDTRHILASVGARRSELEREVYTLPNASAPVSVAVSSGNSINAVQAINAAFDDPRWSWRSLDALSKASGLSKDDTRDLLESMDVETANGFYRRN
jgi:hypothetical protein